jgi:hypothetical protein
MGEADKYGSKSYIRISTSDFKRLVFSTMGSQPEILPLLEEKFYVPAGITVIVKWYFTNMLNG